jgi:hyperosmotically inducible protein
MTRLTTAILAAFLASAPAFAGQNDDFQTFKQAERQVLQYPHFTIFDSVHAQVDDGIVTLTGKVTMPYKRTDIERRVARAAGVTAVRNKIEVLPVSKLDDDLRVAIARAIYGNPNFRHYGSMVNPPIHIVVERGRVTLEGVVNNETDRMVARSIAGQFPAFSIKSELKTVAEARDELERI